MTEFMTEKRLRVSFDATDEVLRRAIYIAAAMQGRSHNDVINGILRDGLGEYLGLARKALDLDEPTPKKKKS